MKFTAPILALFLGLVVALPDPSLPLGMVQKLDARDTVVDKLVFGRSFPCSSNDPTTCCAVRVIHRYLYKTKEINV